ncbi:uncharacterized protein LOC127749040 [Frankliniella occidentalis]|uniref:Telomeric repeat-binding factor 2-interacting protein 1 n=1 Tax=Frankliniella occidentalis TaxID=133901 RepID=A0A9C6U4E0_FRAOC|nr:uncharacterized protein LOC127749040 [Frankliniella occidentalis]
MDEFVFMCNLKAVSLYLGECRESADLGILVEANGGHAHPNPTGDNTIIMSDAQPRSLSKKRQIYSVQFITDSVAANKLRKLNDYLCNFSSHYKPIFDVNAILRREKTWSEVARLKHPLNREPYEEAEDVALLNYVAQNHKDYVSSKKKKFTPTYTRYSKQELSKH